MYTKPAYCTSTHKTSLLVNNERNVHGRNITKVRLYDLFAKCVQNVNVQLYTNQLTVQVYTNQLTVQVYTKPVYCTSVHKTSLIMKGIYMDRRSRNVHGRNITKVRLCELCAKYLQTVTVQVYTKVFSKMKGEIQLWGQTIKQTHLTFALLELLLRSLKVK